METGFGSPVGAAVGETGEGSPVTAYAAVGDTGFGSPVAFTEDEPWLPMAIRGTFQTQSQFARYGWDPAYSCDGGQLVEVEASWPTRGPFTVYLRDAEDALLPDGGCYSGLQGFGSECYANASQQYLRFAFPKVPVGTYDLVVQWEDGGTELDNALRAVPVMVPAYTRSVLKYAGVGLWMEKQ